MTAEPKATDPGLGRIRLRADAAEIARTVDWALALCRSRGIENQRFHAHLALALDEVLANVVSHGWPDPSNRHFSLILRCSDRGVACRVVDDGVAFDPLSAPPPAFDTALEDRAPGGLGVHFLRTVMSAVHYRRRAGRNVLTMCKRVD